MTGAQTRGDWPFFTIVVPTYQRRETVCDMVRATAKIDYDGRFEVVVVVDGSTDGTASALRMIDPAFPLRIVEQANSGAAAARNRGAREAAGEILLFVDDDMMCNRDLLIEHARSYAEGAHAVIGEIVHDEGSPQGFLVDSVEAWTIAARKDTAERLTPFDVFTGQLSVRADVFRTLGGFDESFTSDGRFSNEDVDFGVRLMRGHELRFNPRALTRQRYVVTPRDHMMRAFRAGRGDAMFARKYPELTSELFAQRGATKRIARIVYRPLARVPLLAHAIARTVAFAAHAVIRSPWRRSRRFGRLYNAARQLAYWSAVEADAGEALRSRLLVLCYHSIADRSADPVLAPYSVPPDLFRAQLECLERRGYAFVGPDELVDLLDRATALRPKSVLLTFDDCYRDLAEIVTEVLAPRNIPALAFRVSGLASNTNEWDQPVGAARLDLLAEEELTVLARHKLEMGSHARTHRELPCLCRAEVEAEVVRSAVVSGGEGLARPRFFAYPYGSSDAQTRSAVRDAGYTAAFGTEPRLADRLADRFNLPRVMVLAHDRGWRFRLKTAFPALYARFAERPIGASGKMS